MKNLENHFDRKRRSFLKLSGLLGLGAASAALLPAEKAEAMLFGNKEYKVTKTKLAMGSFVSMTAIHPSKDEAEEAIGLAFEEMDRLNKILTHYDASSPVGSLNSSGKLEAAPQEVLDLVARSLYFTRETGGAFDITVKPLIDLYKDSFAVKHTPTEAEINQAAERIGSDGIQFHNGSLLFKRSDMAVTFDGIGVGYIVDRVSEVLREKGVVNHLINAAGDIRVSGKAAGGKAWTVAIQDPAKSREYPNIVAMQDGAIATSGNYEVFYDNEKLFHHIINPRTGHSPQLASSVTIMAPSCMDADALSTSVFVMEPVAGVQFIERQADYECFVIDKDGNSKYTSGWPV